MDPSTFDSLVPSVIVGLLLLIFRRELFHLFRTWPVRTFKEGRSITVIERQLLLERLHGNTYELLLWFLLTAMTSAGLCLAFFCLIALFKWHDNSSVHVSHWILASIIVVICSTLPTLVRLSTYETTMERLGRKLARWSS